MRRRESALGLMLAGLILLTACQPTPEAEPVKQKDTDKLIEMAVGTAAPEGTDAPAELSVTPAPTPEPIPFSQRFGERFIIDYTTTTGGAKVAGDVKINYLAESTFPMYRVKNVLPSVETGAALAKRLLGTNTLYVQEEILTRSEMAIQMSALIDQMQDEELKESTVEQQGEEYYENMYQWWELELKRLQEQYSQTESEEAPEFAEWQNVWPGEAEQSGPNTVSVRLVADSRGYGDVPRVSISKKTDSDRTFTFSYAAKNESYWGAGYHILEVAEDWSVPCKGASMTPQEAVQQALAVFEGILEVYPTEVRWCDNGNDTERATEKAYVVLLSEKYGNAGCVYTAMRNQSTAEERRAAGDQYSVPWSHESITVAVNEKGILEMNWKSPLEVVELLTDNAALLDFDTVYSLFTQQMNRKLADKDEDTEITLLGVTLGLMRIREQDSPDTSLLVPVWYFRGLQGNTDYDQEVLGGDYSPLCVLNAIDGSVIDTMLGY